MEPDASQSVEDLSEVAQHEAPFFWPSPGHQAMPGSLPQPGGWHGLAHQPMAGTPPARY
jgi:hypothetical protein